MIDPNDNASHYDYDLTLFQRLTEDLRAYSVFVPPPGTPTRSVVREHGGSVLSFRMRETDVGWQFFDVRSEQLVLALSVPDGVNEAAVIDYLRSIPSAVVERPSAATPVVVVSNLRVGADSTTDHTAIVHPDVAKVCPVPKAVHAMPAIRRVMPCFRCEFTDDDRLEEAQWRILRVIKGGWKRAAQPAIQMRFAITSTGVKSTGGKKLGIFDDAQVRKILGEIEAGDGFAEMENWERRRFTLTRADGKWTLVEKKGKAIELFADELTPWLDAFTAETAETAMKGIVR